MIVRKKEIMINIFIIVVLTIFTSISAMSATACDSIITRELEECIKSNFEMSDEILNSEYKDLFLKLSKTERTLLIAGEKHWLTHRDAICAEAFKATYPGAEAGIDKWICLDRKTTTRINEIKLINLKGDAEDFFHAIETVARLYEHGERDRFIDRLTDEFKRDNQDRNWTLYVHANCGLAVRKLHEEMNVCIARQEFYRY